MSSNRLAGQPSIESASNRTDRVLKSLDHFFFAEASARPLGVFRILTTAVILMAALGTTPYLMEIYGSNGFIQGALAVFLQSHPMPTVAAISGALSGFGIEEPTVIRTVFSVMIGALVFLMLGIHTRLAAICALVTHLILKSTGALAQYGFDNFATICLFYCTVMPVGDAFSLGRWLSGQRGAIESSGARLAIRVLQIHLCIVYFYSGIGKASGPQWWDGEAIWRSLMLPMYMRYDMSWVAYVPWVAMALGIGTVVLETLYPVFIWWPRTRRFWLVLIVAMHVGILIFMRLETFGLIMIAMSVAMFGVSAEPAKEAAVQPMARWLPQTQRSTH